MQHQTVAYWGTVLHATLIAIAISSGEGHTQRQRRRHTLPVHSAALHFQSHVCIAISLALLAVGCE